MCIQQESQVDVIRPETVYLRTGYAFGLVGGAQSLGPQCDLKRLENTSQVKMLKDAQLAGRCGEGAMVDTGSSVTSCCHCALCFGRKGEHCFNC